MKKLNVEFYKSAIPNMDHPALNSLRNASDCPITVPVTLYDKGEQVLSADVLMVGTAIAQYNSALWLTLREIERAGAVVIWDECSFLSAQTKFARASLADFDSDNLVPHMRADAMLSFKEVFVKAGDALLRPDNGEGVDGANKATSPQGTLDAFAYRLTASAVLHSASVVSADIDSLRAEQGYFKRAKNALKPFFPF
jgi:hypothetical protein